MYVVFELSGEYTRGVGKEAIMTRHLRRFIPFCMLIALASAPGFAQDADGGSGFDFGMGLGIGVATFADGTWQSLSLTPDLALGKFGIGLDVKLNYKFTGGTGGNEFEIRAADWVPADFQDFLKIYLPKIKYVRWDEKGAPLYIKLGSIDDGTLGNGFILGGYANTLFVPDDRHFGLAFDIDGALFKFPYVGLETFVGDLAEFDVMGARLFVRPLIWLGVPIIKDLQIGGTVAVDRKPYLYGDPADTEMVMVYGADARLPILSMKILSLAVFADVASIEGESYGSMVGFGGRILSFLTYGAQLRVLGPDFIPVYFDATYDVFRSAKYDIVHPFDDGETSMAWYGSLGTSFLNDLIVFNVALDGPFEQPYPLETDNILNWPHLRAVFLIGEGLVKGLSLEASYDKKLIKNFASLIDPTEAAIQARLNYQIQVAVLSFVYKLRYDDVLAKDGDPDTKPWVVTSGIETSIALPF
jgi:hypothetical protein